MNSVAAPVAIMSGICFYVGFYYFWMYIRRRSEKINLTFAIVCFSIALYDIGCVGLYSSQSVEQGMLWQRFQFASLTIFTTSLSWFMYYFADYKSKKFFYIITLSMSIFFILDLTVWNELTFSIKNKMPKHIVIGDIIDIIYQEVDPGLICILQNFAMFGAMIFASTLSIKKLKSGDETSKPIAISLIIFFIAAVSDILVSSSVYSFVYVVEYMIMIIILSMAYVLLNKFVDLHKEVEELNVDLEMKVEERTDELKFALDKLKDMDRLKTNFFANISHEIRTPLTLILSPVESALQGDYEKELDNTFLKNIQKNSIRLLKLINNLLDYSKLEAGKMLIRIKEIDIVKIMDNYVNTVMSATESKDISLSLVSQSESVKLFLDIEKIDKIAMNIFSNALKFTEKGGKIEARIKDDEKNCYIEVEDTGIGIPADKIDLVFDRFGQADSIPMSKYEGTGIGLSLVKELVVLMCGKIFVTSRHAGEYPDDHGTTLTIVFPKGKEHLKNRDGVEFIKGDELEESISDSRRFIGTREMYDLKEGTSRDSVKPDQVVNAQYPDLNILIVEDNREMRNFIKSLLQEYYTIHTAVDGKDGFEKTMELKPDLIVSDVMMPLMNGYEMTRKIKEDDELKRIPVLMLTAKAEIADKIEGLEYGADDYLTKPFNSKELLTRIKSLLKTYEYERIVTERNRVMENELQTARLLQQKLLPQKVPDVSGYRFYVTYIPMDQVGGDFYDYKTDDNFIELFIADVSGHGLPGAFLSMITKMAFEGIANRKFTKDVLNMINSVICRSTVENNYVTMFYCIIDRETNIMKYSNAGHFAPYIYRQESDEFIELQAKGTPLGWFASIDVEEKEIKLNARDRLVLYTDGITECRAPEGNEFGEDRFKDYIRSNIDQSPEIFSAELLKHLKDFSNREDFDDDLCLLVFDVL